MCMEVPHLRYVVPVSRMVERSMAADPGTCQGEESKATS
jgi:hypothetical protein